MADPYGESSLVVRAPARGADPYGEGSLLRPLAAPTPQRTVKSIDDAIWSGLQDSGMVRWMRDGAGPSKELPADAPWYHRVARGAGSMAGDFVPSVIGAIPGVLTANPIGALAGGFAAPMALREAVVEAYSGNHAFDINGVVEVGKRGVIGGMKGAVIGAATGGAGKVLAPMLGKTVGGAVALTAAEVGTMTTVSSVLEGHVPTWQDFMDNAILLGGTKAAIGTAKKMYGIYLETGKTPAEVRADAAADPKLAAELKSGVREVSPETKPGLNGIAEPVRAEITSSKGVEFSMEREFQGKYKIVVEGEQAGAVIYAPRADGTSWHANVAVEAKFQRKGIATAAYDFLESSVVKQPFDQSGGQSAAGAAFRAARDARASSELPRAYAPLALEERIKAALAIDSRPEEVVKIITDPDWKPTADNPPPVAADHIVDRATLVGVAGEIGRIYAKDFEAATRGKVTNKAGLADAVEMVREGLDPHTVGTAASSEQAFARGLIVKSAQMSAEKARQDYVANPADVSTHLRFLHSIEVMAAASRDFEAISAEWGRAGQALKRMKYDRDFLPEAEAMMKAYEKGTPIGEVMAAYGRLTDPHARLAFAKELTKASGFEKFVTAWRASIFSGPLTWLSNIGGGVGKWAGDVVEKPVAAGLEAAVAAAKGDPLKAAQVKARALSPLVGLQLAVLDGIKLVKETKALIDEHGVKGGLAKAKAGYDQRTQEQLGKIDTRPEILRTDADSIVERGAARFTNFSFGMLKFQDLPFRTIGERMKAYEMAVDRVVKEGRVHPGTKEWQAAVTRYLNEPTFGLTAEKALAATKAIEAAGDAQVYSQALGPRLARVSSAISGTPWEFVFPARRAPVNLLDWAVQHTPALNFLSSRWRADFMAGGQRQAEALARVVVGTGLAATAYALSQEGLLTGGSLADPETGAAKEGARIPRYSVKFGDEYYSLARIEPIAKPLMLVADLVEISKSPKLTEEDKGKAATLMVLALANSTISSTYLSGLSSLMRGALEPQRFGEFLAEGYATTLVPKLLGQTAVIMDPYKREVDGVFDAIQSQIPFLREQLVAKRDIWGELTENERLLHVVPVATAKASEDKVKTEAARLYLAIERAPEYIDEKSPLKPYEERTKLTQEQRSVMQEVSGKFALQELSRIVAQPAWDKLPDYAQAAIYRDVLKAANQIGKEKALPADSPERTAKRKQVWDKVLRQGQDAASR